MAAGFSGSHSSSNLARGQGSPGVGRKVWGRVPRLSREDVVLIVPRLDGAIFIVILSF
jgi:hypothetical protein